MGRAWSSNSCLPEPLQQDAAHQRSVGCALCLPHHGTDQDAQELLLTGPVPLHLRALGRLAEAAQPMQAALDTTITLQDWNNAARYAGNLSELLLTLGDVPRRWNTPGSRSS